MLLVLGKGVACTYRIHFTAQEKDSLVIASDFHFYYLIVE